jgi:hypothetical protein
MKNFNDNYFMKLATAVAIAHDNLKNRVLMPIDNHTNIWLSSEKATTYAKLACACGLPMKQYLNLRFAQKKLTYNRYDLYTGQRLQSAE